MDGYSEAQPPGEASIDEGAKLAQPGGLARVRCPKCKHTTYDRQQIETGWCLWCKAYTFIGLDGVDRTGAAALLQVPTLVYSGAMWRHLICGELNEGELYGYQAHDGVWCISTEPIYDPQADIQPYPRCRECGSAVRTLDMISGYWALVVAPVEPVGDARRVHRMSLPLPFTHTVPPGETSPQP